MDNLLEISIFIIAIAFVVLVGFAIWALLVLIQSLKKTEALLLTVRSEVEKVSDDIHKKSQAIEPLFNTVSKAGVMAEKFVERFDEKKTQRKEEVAHWAVDICEFLLLGASFFKKLTERRK